MQNRFDVVVIGGGHAGIEASMAAARMGVATAIVTMDPNAIGRLSCNPSIGGSAKGHLVKEIDALGGVMGRLADRSGLQFKMLNRSKGPAVWSPRAQNDIALYPQYARELLESTANLTIVRGKVVEILVKHDRIVGVRTEDNEEILCKAVILCSGTFLNGVMHTGMCRTDGGRIGEKSATLISDLLAGYGLEKGRLKTGTPPRLDADSINYDVCELHPGDEDPQPFSYLTDAVANKVMCYATATNPTTHDILREGFDQSPMFTGRIKAAGPRYCPSVEDKINRFADRDSHLIVLEPEGMQTNSVYVNGFSTSLPEDVQLRGIRSIAGLERAEFIRPGYAVEYDFFFPYQLRFSLETKAIAGLYFAGQINGTSGYEEAASQGLVAGINAALKLRGEGEFHLRRSEAYIGVMIDDLVNKNTEEPYRIFTSLAEYRLVLRQDNADKRLMKYGHRFGLIGDTAMETSRTRWDRVDRFVELADKIKLKPASVNPYLESVREKQIEQSTQMALLTRRGQVRLAGLLQNDDESLQELEDINHNETVTLAETEIKYKGYIDRQMRDIERFQANEEKRIPDNFDYDNLKSLSNEAREKLSKIRPQSLGQASRIAGVSAADVSILTVYLR